jgi:hypothetical protein
MTGSVGVAQGVAGGGLLQAHHGHDVAGEGGVEVLAGLACIWRMRPTRSLRSLVELMTARALGQRARVDPQVGELAHVGVGHDLEGQGGEGLGRRRGPLDLLPLRGTVPMVGGMSSGLGR